MLPFSTIFTWMTRVTTTVASRYKAEEFSCSDCSLVEACGLPPGYPCEIKLMERYKDPAGLLLKQQRRHRAMTGYNIAP
jgi:hypothetical protein